MARKEKFRRSIATPYFDRSEIGEGQQMESVSKGHSHDRRDDARLRRRTTNSCLRFRRRKIERHGRVSVAGRRVAV